LVEGGVEAQTEQVLKNLKEILAAGGSSLDDVLKVHVHSASTNINVGITMIDMDMFSVQYC
jgi:2-iminobutanoate/2-iminopropanoate deaminase